MKYRLLGKTGVEVSALGFGCMRLPTLGSAERIDEAMATALLHRAIDSGVNYVDTAWFYHAATFGQPGESEPFLGRALAGGWRERINLATKLPQQLVRSRDDMDRFLQLQLERLETDCIDFYLLHGLDGSSWDRMRSLGVEDFLEDARRQGLIRFPAFSFHGPVADFRRIVDEYDDWAFAQIQYNYMDLEFQAGLIGLRYAARKGIGVVVMEPLKGGRLGDKLPAEMSQVFSTRPEGWSPAQWALRYVWNDPAVSLLLSGMNTEEQLTENLAAADSAEADSLLSDQMIVFELAREAMRSRMKADCTACRYCMPCPQGVAIPEALACLNASAMWETSDRWLTGYLNLEGKPDLCNRCGQCELACPQGLPVPDLLADTAATFGGGAKPPFEG